MSDTDVLAVAERFFAAIPAGDREVVDELYAPDVEVWHSVTNRTADRATAPLPSSTGSWPRASIGYGSSSGWWWGIAQPAARATVTVPGHEPLVMAVSIYLTIVDGRITRIDEYGDREQSELLMAWIPLAS
jgi:ketosteroid isomerase-like protein